MRTTIIAMAAAGLTATAALAANTQPAGDPDQASAMMNIDTQTFLPAVMSSNEFEIKSSEMAEQKAGDMKDLADFAKQMVADHKKAGDDMKAALQKSGTTPPPPKLSPKHEAMLKLLEGADGKDFAMLYTDMQAGAHMEAVSLFRTYAASGDDPAVTAFAKQTLPTLEMHLDHVKKIVAAH